MFAARIMDLHVCPMVNGIVPHVGGPIVQPIMGKPCLIGGMPAAGVGSQCVCVGPPDSIIPTGPPKALVNNTPLAKMGDMTSHGGSIVIGCFTVMVGAGGMSPSAISGMVSQATAAAGEVTSQAAEAMDSVQAANDEINALLEQGNLSEDQQARLNELQSDFGESIEGMGMNDDGFEDWTA